MVAAVATAVRLEGRMPVKDGFRPPMAGVWMARVGEGVDEDEPEAVESDDGEDSDEGDDGGEIGVVGSFSVNRGGGNRTRPLSPLDARKPPAIADDVDDDDEDEEPQDALDE